MDERETERLKTMHAALSAGRAAHRDGHAIETCPPFATSVHRMFWLVGWYDAESERARTAAILKPPGRSVRQNRRRAQPCPRCGAPVGRPCLSASGKVLPDEHAARYNLPAAAE